jgi:hypothetical protein
MVRESYHDPLTNIPERLAMRILERWRRYG